MIRRNSTPKALEEQLRKDTYMMLQFFVAKELGLTLNELRARMTETEILGWNAYFNIQADEERKAYERAKKGRR